jgi:hypothetical protein
MNECEHRRIKKNYPFGRKSQSFKYCLDCGIVITNKQIKDMKKRRKGRFKK